MLGRGTQKYRPSAMMRVVAATRRRVGLGTWSESATWPCYRNTLDRSCLQGNFPGVSASGGKASASGQRLFGHSRLAPTPLGRRTTALQNQGDQLSLSLGHQLTVSPQHGQILPLSSNGGTEPGTSQSRTRHNISGNVCCRIFSLFLSRFLRGSLSLTRLGAARPALAGRSRTRRDRGERWSQWPAD